MALSVLSCNIILRKVDEEQGEENLHWERSALQSERSCQQ